MKNLYCFIPFAIIPLGLLAAFLGGNQHYMPFNDWPEVGQTWIEDLDQPEDPFKDRIRIMEFTIIEVKDEHAKIKYFDGRVDSMAFHFIVSDYNLKAE